MDFEQVSENSCARGPDSVLWSYIMKYQSVFHISFDTYVLLLLLYIIYR